MTKIVILGGGYAGVHAGKLLHKAYKKSDDVQISLIDANPYHTIMTELHEVAGGRVDNGCVKISFDRIFSGKKVEVFQDRINNIDREKQQLHSDTATYDYDYLIMGTGAESTDFGIPGVKEHSLPLWSYQDALDIKDHIREMFRQASYEKDPQVRRNLMTFVVAGAGFTGVEMIGELIEKVPQMCSDYNIDPDEVQLINVEGLDSILKMIPEKPRMKAQRYLEKKGVKILLNSLITNAEEGSFTLKDGTVIPCGTLIWTCGIKGGSFGVSTGLTVGHVDRLKVHETMQSADHENLYVVGDAQWFLENERPVPQIVEAAEQTASVAVKNIISQISGGKAEHKFKSNFHGFMVSIGGRYAVSHTGGFSMSGIPAVAVKHLVNVYYLHTVCGVNGWWKYLQHEIFDMKNKRTLLGGFITNNIQSLWAVPLRVWLGLMWLIEGLNKVGEGWLKFDLGTKSGWMFSSGVVQAGQAVADTTSAASEAVVEEVVVQADAVAAATGDVVEQVVETVTMAAADTVAAASDAVETVVETAGHTLGALWDTSGLVLRYDSAVVTWFRETFMDSMAAYLPYQFFQTMIVSVEVLIGLALIGGLFVFPAAGVSIIMCFVFIFSGFFSWSQVWFIFAAFLMLGGAGRVLGLDYWVQPWLKKWWNGSSLARKSYLYFGEPRRKKRKA
ncbi:MULTISPECIES: NAD(P)/FAD-dependent oxidoreductase [unclassified Oceanispirochaeta]|uniref:NAD(P)/FAD-dependent oxidoreductase n=1 Tax=unclassified Oceanispirochaeta TaxID=2635722 RepID=UPI000E094382|nr:MULTISPECIES: NAD(P)/FAD-dependent oxidoreductase [unclassified Oceanispirochaeta]MBF9014220.1 NAD(P)/FAD-dependent oxidoreductase [Oceanispirochaeta sp. M2]NPD71106.1 NAD(P)/FAD-dependent oxidoreductase [Oceanispirochaeta sp. M1]RDG33502.1 NAD(P)/FAD-dependent oxidoreductase [Oceanispirochaeta sp. M1]